MTDILNAAKQRFQTGYYVYGPRPNFDGTKITRSNATGIGIDCSNLLSQSLLAAGYNVDQLATSSIFDDEGNLQPAGAQYYAKIDPATTSIRPGDIVMFWGPFAHVGIVTWYKHDTGTGEFFGSQSSTGPGQTSFTTVPGKPKFFFGGTTKQGSEKFLGFLRVTAPYDPAAAAAKLAAIDAKRAPALQRLGVSQPDTSSQKEVPGPSGNGPAEVLPGPHPSDMGDGTGPTAAPLFPRIGRSLAGGAPPARYPLPGVVPLQPGMPIPGAEGPTSIGGPNGHMPVMPPARPGARIPNSPPLAADPTLSPLRFAPEERQQFGPFTVPPSFRSGVFSGFTSAADKSMAGPQPDAPVSPMPAFGVPRVSAPIGSAAPPRSRGGIEIGDGGGVGDPSLRSMPYPLEPLHAPDRNRAQDDWASSLPRQPLVSPAEGAPGELLGPLAALFGHDPSNPFQAMGTPTLPINNDGYGPPSPPVQIGDGRGIGNWWDSLRPAFQAPSQGQDSANVPGRTSIFATGAPSVAFLPQDKPGGILGMLIDAGHIDPANPDQPPAGALLGMIQEYLRNNPDVGR
jgi:hypothetical protein